ncbi:MAG: Smr/MutS family protein [Steroidobacteraceae bacterium]
MNDEDERKLFRAAMRDVRPLRQTRPLPRAPKIPPRAALRRADEARALAESLDADAADLEVETGDEISYRRNGVPEATMRRLRRGLFARRDELDLHGMTRAEARLAVLAFLADASRRGLHCVRIVHGKGRGSGDRGPVLKAAVNRWLRRHDGVRAFCSARRPDGGTGALYVLLDS